MGYLSLYITIILFSNIVLFIMRKRKPSTNPRLEWILSKRWTIVTGLSSTIIVAIYLLFGTYLVLNLNYLVNPKLSPGYYAYSVAFGMGGARFEFFGLDLPLGLATVCLALNNICLLLKARFDQKPLYFFEYSFLSVILLATLLLPVVYIVASAISIGLLTLYFLWHRQLRITGIYSSLIFLIVWISSYSAIYTMYYWV